MGGSTDERDDTHVAEHSESGGAVGVNRRSCMKREDRRPVPFATGYAPDSDRDPAKHEGIGGKGEGGRGVTHL